MRPAISPCFHCTKIRNRCASNIGVSPSNTRALPLKTCAEARHRYTGVPYFWTYHFGKRFEYLGHASEWDEMVIDGELDQQAFVALYVKDGKVVAVLACEREAQTARLLDAMEGGLSLLRQ